MYYFGSYIFMVLYEGHNLWISTLAYDSKGKRDKDCFSLHGSNQLETRKKWIKFFKKVNKKRLVETDIRFVKH